MNRLIALICTLGICWNCSGQKEDYIWLSGFHAGILYDTNVHHYFATNKIDFNTANPTVTLDTVISINFNRAAISYCDSNGNLLFYSNGIEIRNKWDEVIQNSRKMNDGWVDNVFNPSFITNGRPDPNAIIVLPIPNLRTDFLFFHCFPDSTPGITSINYPKLLITRLSMSDNNGHGKVLYRDSLLLSDVITPCITACRHANGQDWWILVAKQNSNCYYRILLTEHGASIFPNQTCLGEIVPFGDAGICSFSPDGSKYAALDYSKGILLYDFDRCNGQLTNAHYYPIPQLVDSGWIFPGCSFSPNSRFLYGTIGIYLFQFDMSQPDPLANPDTIARFDGFMDPLGSYYNAPQIAPDGKIYIAAASDEGNYSVIDSPDLKGAACHFRPHGLSLPALQFGPPIHPNYRLGAQVGGPCDTSSIGISELSFESSIKLSPNPVSANGSLTVYSSEEGKMYFVDGLGRLLYTANIHAGSNMVSGEMLHMREGMVFYSAQLPHGTANGKVVIIR